MKIVVALDGDLLVSEDVSRGMAGQREAITHIMEKLVEMITGGHELVITHGNAPQVGFMLFRAEAASHIVHSLPLDICGADTQGATGYMLQQVLRNWLQQRGIDKEIATLVTQVVIAEADTTAPAPTKGIGPYFDDNKAQAYKDYRGWQFALVPGRGYQRTVTALKPTRIIEANSIRHLLERGIIVICAGGGGIPVQFDTHGELNGVEAVVDKAYTATLLAQEIQADKIIFVSYRERLEHAFQLSLSNGLHRLTLAMLNETLEHRAGLEDTTRHKLIASRDYLMSGGKPVLMVPPEQLSADPDACCGIQLVLD